MSLYRETPGGAAQKADMKLATLAPMALISGCSGIQTPSFMTAFHPVASPVAAPAVVQPPCSQRSRTR